MIDIQAGSFAERLCQGLRQQGFFVDGEFLSPSEYRPIIDDFSQIHAQKLFRSAGTGLGDRHRPDVGDIRRDEIFWFEPAAMSAVQSLLWARLTELKQVINLNLFMSLWDLEGHYAVYPPGGFYLRHRDRFSNDEARTISVVIYLNPDWRPEHGGELKLFLESDRESIVEPRAGTLVCFLSEEIEHEVQRSHAIRRSFAGWFRQRVRLKT